MELLSVGEMNSTKRRLRKNKDREVQTSNINKNNPVLVALV